jgi:hypothetical protein
MSSPSACRHRSLQPLDGDRLLFCTRCRARWLQLKGPGGDKRKRGGQPLLPFTISPLRRDSGGADTSGDEIPQVSHYQPKPTGTMTRRLVACVPVLGA